MKKRVRLVWDLPILDIIAVVLSITSILLTIYLTTSVKRFHEHVKNTTPVSDQNVNNQIQSLINQGQECKCFCNSCEYWTNSQLT